jgi:hypothetical protein
MSSNSAAGRRGAEAAEMGRELAVSPLDIRTGAAGPPTSVQSLQERDEGPSGGVPGRCPAGGVARRGRQRGARAVVDSWWSSGDPEVKRRRRVAGYKAYAVEARVKASLGKGSDYRFLLTLSSDITFFITSSTIYSLLFISRSDFS